MGIDMGIETAAILADSMDTGVAGVGGTIGGLLGYLIGSLVLSFVFVKAGEPRWAAFVPLYNLYVHTRIAGFNPWLFLLYLVPIANIVFSIVVALRLAKAFGHSGVFGFFLLWLLSIIGYLVVGLGSDTYDRSRIPA